MVARSRTMVPPRSPKKPTPAVGSQQGIAPAPRLLSSPGPLGSRRGWKCWIKPDGRDVRTEGDTYGWQESTQPLQLGPSLSRQCQQYSPALQRTGGGWWTSWSRPRINPCLLKALFSAVCCSNTLGKARTALQEAQEQYKPKSLKCQEKHPVGKSDFVEFTSWGWKLRSAGDLSRQGGTEHYRGVVNGNRKSWGQKHSESSRDPQGTSFCWFFRLFGYCVVWNYCPSSVYLQHF